MPVVTLAKAVRAFRRWGCAHMSGCLPTQRAAAMIVLNAVKSNVLASTERYAHSSNCRPGRDLQLTNILCDHLLTQFWLGLRSDLSHA